MKNFFTLFCLLMAAFTINAQAIFLEEGFDGNGIPDGWTQTTTGTDGGWKFGTGPSLSGSSFAIPSNGGRIAATNDDKCNCDKLNEYLIMPEFDFSDYDALAMKFDYYYFDAYYNSQERAYIAVSTDGGFTWDDVAALPGSVDWQNGFRVNLSAFGGESSVLIAFHYSDGGGWAYGWAIDNVSVYSPAKYDVAVTRLNVPRFEVVNQNVTIGGEVTNEGSENLTSFDLTWSDGVNEYTDHISGIDVPYLGTYTFTASESLSLDQAISYDYTVSVSNPNDEEDQNPNNNEGVGVVSGVTYIPNKKMFTEEATGTWCGWCPRGTEWMDWMAEFHSDQFVGVAVHNQDPMALAAYDSGVNNFPGFSGYPSVIVDRDAIWDPSELEEILPTYAARIAPVAPSVYAEIDVATRTLTAKASAEFVTQLSNLSYRFNVILSEDNVRGTDSGYNQSNYYAGGSSGEPIPNYGLNWSTLPSTVPASQLHYNHVGRALLGGWAGTEGSIPSDIEAGEIIEKTYTLNNFNKNWNPFNMRAVVLILDSATGLALNAEKDQIQVNCPGDVGLIITVAEDTIGLEGSGSIHVSMVDPNLGFGGYTFKLDNGETGTDFFGLETGTYKLTATDKINCSQEVEVEVGLVSGVRNIESLTAFSLTPNPASSVSLLNANFDKTVDMQVSIQNIAGQVVETLKYNHVRNVQHTFNLTEFADGVYFVKVIVGNQVHTERLVISR